MAISTIYADTSAGYIRSQAYANYAVARAGKALTPITDACREGQDKNINAWRTVLETFIEFDTSSIGADAVISAVLSMNGDEDDSALDYYSQVRLTSAWATPGTLAISEWVPGDDLASKTLLAQFFTSGYVDAAYNAYTSEDAFITNLNVDGTTSVLICNKNTVDNVEPTTTDENMTWFSSDGGEITDPKLAVEHAASISDNIGTHF